MATSAFVEFCRARALLSVGLALAGFGLHALLQAAPASAAPCVRIYRIYYNSPGKDTGSNASLNAEFISLYNSCPTGRYLKAWKIRDAAGHTYTFGNYTLGGHGTVRVHTGQGSNTAADRYWGLGWYVWNNDGDTAYLRDRSGTLLDTCSYNDRSESFSWTNC
jgi:Lamin Tail Domain